MSRASFAWGAALLTLAVSVNAWATGSVPLQIVFQGNLTDPGGTPLDGPNLLRFALYTGGTRIWYGEYATVAVTSGRLSVALGGTGQGGQALNPVSGVPIANTNLPISAGLISGVDSNTLVEIEVEIWNGSSFEVVPTRFPVASALFAIKAESVGGFDAAQLAKVDGSGRIVAPSGAPVIDSAGNWIGPAFAGVTGTSGLTGASGASGATGATGQAGTAGAIGATGAGGVGGSLGANGATGDTGAAGTNGLNGATGGSGAAGASGATGASGAQGASGSTGQTGAGSTGASGITGLSGATGASGASGATGGSGAAGNTGATGSSGAAGNTGATGASGAAGNTGATGASGAAGMTGATGSSGTAGNTGATGSSGAAGNTGGTGSGGAAGNTGATGASGAAGNSGATGGSGPTGSNGATGSSGATGATGATASNLLLYLSDGTTVLGNFLGASSECLLEYSNTSTGVLGSAISDARRMCVDANLVFASADCSGTAYVVDEGTQHIGYDGTNFYAADRSAHDCTADADCSSGATATSYGSYRTLAGGCTVDGGITGAYPSYLLTACGPTRTAKCVVK